MFLKKAFSLIEVILSSALFILIVTAFVTAYLYGQESSAMAGARARAVMLAEEGLEAARNIRDASFSNLIDGNHGLAIIGNQWSFSGAQDVTDIFTRDVRISSVNSNTKQVVCNISWQQNPRTTGSVILSTYLTNWQAVIPPTTSCAQYCIALPSGYSGGNCRQNSNRCNVSGEVYQSGGDSQCVLNYPGDPSRDTCCCIP